MGRKNFKKQIDETKKFTRKNLTERNLSKRRNKKCTSKLKNSGNIFSKNFCMKKKKKNKPAAAVHPPRHRRRRLAAPPRRAASQHVWSLGLLPASPSTPLRGGSGQRRRIRGQADTGVGEEALQSTSTPAPSRCLGGLGLESDSNGGHVICNSHRGGPRLRLPLGRGWS